MGGRGWGGGGERGGEWGGEVVEEGAGDGGGEEGKGGLADVRHPPAEREPGGAGQRDVPPFFAFRPCRRRGRGRRRHREAQLLRRVDCVADPARQGEPPKQRRRRRHVQRICNGSRTRELRAANVGEAARSTEHDSSVTKLPRPPSSLPTYSPLNPGPMVSISKHRATTRDRYQTLKVSIDHWMVYL